MMTGLRKILYKQRYLMLMLFPFIIWAVLFCYLPLYGWSFAFMEYVPGRDFFSNPWVGLKYFKFFLSGSGQFYSVIRNTLCISSIYLVLEIPLAVALAIILHEMRFRIFKRVAQTISYLPYFVSWVIVATIFYQVFSMQGVLNDILIKTGIIQEPIFFLGSRELAWPILIFTGIWKNIGWDSIIQLGAIASIDPELYEAAYVDGAKRFQRIWYITLPGMMPTIAVILVLNTGWILNSGFDQYYLFTTPANRDFTDVIDTYVYRYGLSQGQFSFATSVGIFKTVVSLILLFSVNRIFKAITGKSVI